MFFYLRLALIGMLVCTACTSSIPEAPTIEDLCRILTETGTVEVCDPANQNQAELLENRFEPGFATSDDVRAALGSYLIDVEQIESGSIERYAIIRTLLRDYPIAASFRYDNVGILVVVWVSD